jgi:hypothetical protein
MTKAWARSNARHVGRRALRRRRRIRNLLVRAPCRLAQIGITGGIALHMMNWRPFALLVIGGCLGAWAAPHVCMLNNACARGRKETSFPYRERSGEAVAYHAAGHAVAAHSLDVPFSHVGINEQPDSRGRVAGIKPNRRRQDWLERYCIVTLAGPFAQRRYNPRSHWRYGGSGGKVARTYCRFLEARVEALVAQRWPAIEAVARALLLRKTMSRDEVRQTIFEIRVRPALREKGINV